MNKEIVASPLKRRKMTPPPPAAAKTSMVTSVAPVMTPRGKQRAMRQLQHQQQEEQQINPSFSTTSTSTTMKTTAKPEKHVTLSTPTRSLRSTNATLRTPTTRKTAAATAAAASSSKRKGTPYRQQIIRSRASSQQPEEDGEEHQEIDFLRVPQELELNSIFGQEVEAIEHIHTDTPLTRSTLRQIKAEEQSQQTATPTRPSLSSSKPPTTRKNKK